MEMTPETTEIIGGADKTTSVLLTGRPVLTAVLLAAAAVIRILRRKK